VSDELEVVSHQELFVCQGRELDRCHGAAQVRIIGQYSRTRAVTDRISYPVLVVTKLVREQSWIDRREGIQVDDDLIVAKLKIDNRIFVPGLRGCVKHEAIDVITTCQYVETEARACLGISADLIAQRLASASSSKILAGEDSPAVR
jgi:hypothetical protein